MATPKTPRKRAETKKPDDKGTASDVTPTTTADAPVSTPFNTAPIDPKPTDAPPQDLVAQDAVVILDEPEDLESRRDSKPVEAAKPEGDTADTSDTKPPMDAPDSTKPSETPAEPDKPAAEPTAEPTADPKGAPTVAPTIVKSSPGFFPLVLGGVVAAGLGFGLARYVVPEGWPVPGSSPLQTQLNQQADEIEGLRAELQSVAQNDGSSAILAELGTVRATADSALEAAEAAKTAAANVPAATPSEDFAPRLAALEDRLSALEKRPAGNAAADPAAISQLKADIESLQSGLAAQKQAAETMAQEAEAKRADTAAQAQTVLLSAALTKVEAALQSGAPFAEPLALLADAGIAVPAILTDNAESGLPTIASLTASFDEPARMALEESLRGNMGETWSERVGSFLRAQTGARSLTPQEGNDPDAILSRANAAVSAGDLQAALAEIATMPEPAQAALSDWAAQAKLHLDAQTATVELATALSER